jgi:hypothetical protein
MSSKPNRKPWMILGVLVFIVLSMCMACVGVFYWFWNLPPIPAGPVPQPQAAISVQNAKKVEKLYEFSHPGTISVLAWSPNGRLLASGQNRYERAVSQKPEPGQDPTPKPLRVWDTTTGQELQSIPGFPYRLYDVAFSPDSQWVAVSTDHGAVIWNVADGTQIQTIKESIGQIAFSPDGQNILVIDGTQIVFWNIATGNPAGVYSGYTGFAFAPDNKLFAWGPEQIKPSRGFQLSELEPARTLWTSKQGAPQRVVLSHNGKLLAELFGMNGEIRAAWLTLLDATNGKELHTWLNLTYDSCVAFSPDDTLIASEITDGKMFFPSIRTALWDVNEGKIAELGSGDGCVFSPDGRFLAISGLNGVQLWGIKPEGKK